MKIALHVKILLGYLLFGFLGFLTIAFFSSNMILHYLVNDRASQLYNEANLLAATCREEYSGNSLSLVILEPSLKAIQSYFDSDVWIIEYDGTITYCGNRSDLVGSTLDGFSRSESGRGKYTTGNFYGTYDSQVLTVMAPISANYKTYGYVVLHLPFSVITAVQNQILRIIAITFALIFLISLIILAIVQYYIFSPIKKITKAANEYATGNLTYPLEIMHDDEIGYLATTLSAMAKDLSTKEADQKKFISNVSHDFRSPLTSIKGYLEAMLDGTIPPELHEKYMRRVISETERLTKLTQSTLAMQSLDSRGNLLDRTMFDINQVIRDCGGTFESICRPKKITLDLEFENMASTVWADRGKIQQVVYNLLDNAIKFSSPSSTIWVSTYEKRDKVFVSVKDSGCGIPKESLKKIWERFYKSDASRGKDRTGTGLGLSITKEIITSHGENIDVISTEGIGTEFIFSLPKQKPADKI